MDQKKTAQLEHQRFVSLKYFCVTMLGYSSSVSYYNHMHEPGWPQRVWVAGRPMLVYEECLAFVQGLIDARVPVEVVKPERKKRKPPKRARDRKGRTGRPVKPHPAA